MKRLTSLSVVFPAFNDEQMIPLLVKKTEKLLPRICDDYEIIVVNDGSSDGTAKALSRLGKQIHSLRVITHQHNLGYGATILRGFVEAKKSFIFYTDGDGQYDVEELPKLVRALDENTDMVAGYKFRRFDPWYRLLLGNAYNRLVKTLLQLRVRDVDCDFRLFKKEILKGVKFSLSSGLFDAEFMMKLENKKINIKEVAVHHYPRRFGNSQFFSFKHITKSLWDLGKFCLRGNI